MIILRAITIAIWIALALFWAANVAYLAVNGKAVAAVILGSVLAGLALMIAVLYIVQDYFERKERKWWK